MPGPLSSDVITPAVKPDTSADGVIDLLNMDDAKPESKPKAEEEPEPKPKSKESKEEKEEEEEEPDIDLKEAEDEGDEDKLDLKSDDEAIEAPPRKKEIIAKFPTIFKEFPFLEKMMFRDRQYTELFGSFDDAKEVAERAQNLSEFEHDLLDGNIERTLISVKSADNKAFDKIVDNYLNVLAKVDKEAYFEVVGNTAKHIIKEMVQEARNSKNEDLQKAALILNQFLFASSQYVPPKPRVAEDETKNKELEEERKSFTRERFETARNDLQTRVDNTLRATISEYIDPKGEMSPYVKKNAIRDALVQLHQTIGQDGAFRKSLDKLWESAFSEKFSQNSVNRIRSAYLGRSKQILGVIIKKARAEALKDTTSSRRKSDENEEDETPRSRRGPINAGRPHQSSGKSKGPEKGESVLEFLSRD